MPLYGTERIGLRNELAFRLGCMEGVERWAIWTSRTVLPHAVDEPET